LRKKDRARARARAREVEIGKKEGERTKERRMPVNGAKAASCRKLNEY
jgi:hypothetical protein